MGITKYIVKVPSKPDKVLDLADVKTGLASGAHTITVESYDGTTLLETKTRNITIAEAGGTYLLDLYPGAAYAYDFFKLSSTYTGACIKVRRASDNVETDVGFVNDKLDESGLTDFAGASDCFRVTRYDQTGNGRHFTQTSASNQPKIVSAGVIIKEGTHIIEQFDGVNDFAVIPALGTTSNYHQLFINMKIRNANTEVIVVEQGDNYSNYSGAFLLYRSAGSPKQLTMANVSGANYKTGKLDNQEVTAFKLFNIGIDRVSTVTNNGRVNGVAIPITNITNTANMQGVPIPSQPYYVGARSGGTVAPSQLNLATMVMYPTDQSANLAGIENKINSNYNLY